MGAVSNVHTSVYDALINVPGSFRCAKCGFVQMFSVLRASDGAVGVNLSPDPERMICPNDGEALRPTTWQQRAEEAETEWGKCLERDAALRQQVKIARGALISISKRSTGGPHAPGQIKSEHRAIITEARAALALMETV